MKDLGFPGETARHGLSTTGEKQHQAVLYSFPAVTVQIAPAKAEAERSAFCNLTGEFYTCTTARLAPALRKGQLFTLGPRGAWPDDLAAIFLKDGRIMLGHHAGSDADALYITESMGRRRRGIRLDSITRTAPVYSVTEIFR